MMEAKAHSAIHADFSLFAWHVHVLRQETKQTPNLLPSALTFRRVLLTVKEVQVIYLPGS